MIKTIFCETLIIFDCMHGMQGCKVLDKRELFSTALPVHHWSLQAPECTLSHFVMSCPISLQCSKLMWFSSMIRNLLGTYSHSNLSHFISFPNSTKTKILLIQTLIPELRLVCCYFISWNIYHFILINSLQITTYICHTFYTI